MKSTRRPFLTAARRFTKQAAETTNKAEVENTPHTPFSVPSYVKSPQPSRKLVGRGVASPADKYPKGSCLCARPKSIVFCNACGYFRPGRKRILCPQHPTVHFLYDIETCEKCHASFYLDEYIQ